MSEDINGSQQRFTIVMVPQAGGQVIEKADNTAIEIENISKTFKNIKALDNVTLTVYRNEVFGLLGPNGSGKTTLLHILCTVMPPDTINPSDGHNRKCRIMGHNVFRAQDKIRQIIGYVPQKDPLYGDLSALDNLIFFSAPYGLGRDEQKKRIEELLGMLGLYERRNDLVRTFSGGMLKRISIICALVHRPSMLFFDEVTVGLDTSLRHEVWQLIRELSLESTIVVTTHYIPDAENYCDRVALILKGKILDIGSPKELIQRHPPAGSLEEVVLILERQM
jgi:ABC-2 type transport system ATP-binding protein